MLKTQYEHYLRKKSCKCLQRPRKGCRVKNHKACRNADLDLRIGMGAMWVVTITSDRISLGLGNEWRMGGPANPLAYIAGAIHGPWCWYIYIYRWAGLKMGYPNQIRQFEWENM